VFSHILPYNLAFYASGGYRDSHGGYQFNACVFGFYHKLFEKQVVHDYFE
jgi:hypothetical protein